MGDSVGTVVAYDSRNKPKEGTIGPLRYKDTGSRVRSKCHIGFLSVAGAGFEPATSWL